MLRSLALAPLSGVRISILVAAALATSASGCSSKDAGPAGPAAVAVTPTNTSAWCDVKAATTCSAVNVCGVCVKNPPTTAI
ncbi:MAG: hypothetical protein ABI175_09135, partial [Polyangiales bacterium]